MTLPRIDLVIFDCDGVLIDSEVISAEVLVGVLAAEGVAVDTAHIYRNFTGKSFPKVAGIIAGSTGQTLSPEFEARYRAGLFEAFTTRLRPTVGVREVLEALACATCVATSSTPARLARSLALTGLAGFFGGDTFTASQVANGKPAPDLFHLAAARMGADPAHCLVIEDTEVGLVAARAAGMTVWRYTGGAHLAGATPALPKTLADIPSFDNWADFYQMAPELRRRGAGAW